MGRRPIREVLATGALCAALIAAAAGPAQAITAAPDPGKPDYDARDGSAATIPQATADARTALAKALGPQAGVGTDPVTGGLRTVGRADGFLTAPSAAAPQAIALGYVRDHAAAFGLDAADIATLQLTSSSTSAGDGVTHLTFAQLDHGVGAYDSALVANVSADGRLINAGGAPVHDLAPPSTDPPLGPGAARAAAQRDLGVTPDGDPGTTTGTDATRPTTFPGGDHAQLVTLSDPDGDHLAWQLTVTGTDAYTYEVLVDAASGAVLTRHSLTDAFASSANVVQHHPGDGTLAAQDITPWLAGTAANGLRGPNAHAYPDRSFPDGMSSGDGDTDVAPSSGTDFAYTLTTANPGGDPLRSGQHCPADGTGCTWDGSSLTGAWATANVPEAAAQAFYYVNKYHDWLGQAPVGFDAASHDFDSSGATADPLNVEVDDYSVFDNSNMTTPPDGQSPTMQLGLYSAFGPAVNSADDATLVYHEYTHGLTQRLVGGDGAANGLIARQAQAMSEGWSDWYALDFLTAEGQISDDVNTPGQEVVGDYVSGNANTGVRDDALDCHVGDSGPHCPGTATAGSGGFTFGDLGKVADYDAAHPYFEVHSDGEIWGETLWDLRQKLGGYTARALITSALRLAQKQPGFLDMRNYILQADATAAALPGGVSHRNEIWAVFAHRGMGYSAHVTSANATHAVEAFDTPPVAAAGAPSVASLPLEQDTPLTIPIANPSSAALTGVHATLTAASAGVTVTQGSASLGTLAAGASGNAAFSVRVAASAGCGTVASATLTITSGAGTQSFPVSLPVGAGRSGAFTQAVAAPGTVPDNYASSRRDLTSTLTVPSPGRIGALRVTLAATHSFIGDLHATLTSPSGTTVDLMERPGVDTGATGFFSRANLVAATPVIFDDTALNPIQDIANTETTISGPWKPNEPLARFAGEPRNGTWTLHVSDLGPSITGTVSSWSLETDDPACAITDAPTGLSDDDATFHARLDPGTAAGTTVAFELGKTTAYGSRSPGEALSGGGGGGLQDYAVSTGGLTAGDTYHVRAIVLRGGTVVAAGADQAFVAGSQTVPDGPRGGGTGDGGGNTDTGGATGSGGGSPGTNDGQGTPVFKLPKATMRSLLRTVRLDRRNRIVLTLRATPGRAKGSVKLLSGRTSLGTGSFTVPSNGRVRIAVKATKKLLALLKRKPAGVRAKVTLRIGVTPFTATLTIKPYKKPAKARG